MIGNGQIDFSLQLRARRLPIDRAGAGLDIHFQRFTVRAINYEYHIGLISRTAL